MFYRMFQLPLDVISSIEKDGLGYVRYSVIAVLDLPEDGSSEMVAGRSTFTTSLLKTGGDQVVRLQNEV